MKVKEKQRFVLNSALEMNETSKRADLCGRSGFSKKNVTKQHQNESAALVI